VRVERTNKGWGVSHPLTHASLLYIKGWEKRCVVGVSFLASMESRGKVQEAKKGVTYEWGGEKKTGTPGFLHFQYCVNLGMEVGG